jgi:transcriptional regulator GlxA family with amidase domain
MEQFMGSTRALMPNRTAVSTSRGICAGLREQAFAVSIRGMRERQAPSRFGIVIYEDVEPIDIGGTVGVISMARRVLPAIESVTIAARTGPVRLAGGLTVLAQSGFDDHPPCDCFVVCGGPGWQAQVTDQAMLAFLRRLPGGSAASVCTGGLILAAAGLLDGKRATTRRHAAGAEPASPLARLGTLAARAEPIAAAVVDDRGMVTSGGVSLAIDGTLYLIGRLYGEDVRDEIARLIEYDRAFAANRAALGHSLA